MGYLSKAAIAAAAALLAIVATSGTAHAQRVLPMIYELAPSGSGSQETLRIENTSTKPITVEFLAEAIELDEFGNETGVPADDDFLIFPPQAIVREGQTQSVRVKYIGEPGLEQSKAYRISVNQIPIDLSEPNKEKIGIGFTVNFGTLANVVPNGVSADVSVTNISAAEDNNWDIRLRNDGNKFARLSTTKWVVRDGSGKSQSFRPSEVGKLTGKNLLLPQSDLVVKFPAIEGFDPSTTTIEIEIVK